MITAIDLFSGAGGMSLGVKMAGIKPVIAVEFDKHAAKTYTFNHPETKVLTSDIRRLKNSYFNFTDKIQILFGGPPCQGFSTSNQRTRNQENQNNWLFLEFLRIAKHVSPEWIVFENVSGLIETGKGYFLQEILKQLSGVGYTCSWWVLNAADYGIPQVRRRLFIIGSKKGEKILEPPKKSDKAHSVKEAIGDLPVIQNGHDINWLPYSQAPLSSYARQMRGDLTESPNHLVTRNSETILERYKYIPQGGNWEDIPHHLMSNYKDYSRCHTGIYRRLKDDEPSVVIGNYRKNMLIHPTQNRGLSVREAARIQSFPDSFEFRGSIGFQQQQVGNAVPPILAREVFKLIAANI